MSDRRRSKILIWPLSSFDTPHWWSAAGTLTPRHFQVPELHRLPHVGGFELVVSQRLLTTWEKYQAATNATFFSRKGLLLILQMLLADYNFPGCLEE
ncbi:MAG: hypothetical protein GY790_12735 [Bacteroidetes bacterium]|nr:hypothetical protein [Bacteroidota bacterium]